MTHKPTRIFVHAGFHKTGTTSLQDFLRSNKKNLRDHYRYFGKADFLAAGAHARIYGQRPFPWRLWRFRRSFRKFLNGIDDFHTIILSRETFSGGMPGHRKIGGRLMTSYQPAARALATVIVAELRRRFGADADIVFVYTVRDTASWINSVHGHLLRSIRLQDDLSEFTRRFPKLPSPAEEARQLAAFLDPLPVMTIRLEQFYEHPEGPAAALLDLLDIPPALRQTLTPAKRKNIGEPADTRDKFLTLNRTIRDMTSLKTKKQMASTARPQSETK